MPDLLLLTRPDCELCEEFLAALVQWEAGHELPPLRVLNVDSDPLLQRRFGLQIPVLLCDGARVCAGQFEPAELARLLRAR